jgi:hypothetical protein
MERQRRRQSDTKIGEQLLDMMIDKTTKNGNKMIGHHTSIQKS